MENYIPDYISNNATKSLFNVITNFNFEKVSKTMEHLNWYWQVNYPHIPDEFELRDKALDMLINCYHGFWRVDAEENKKYKTECGGLSAAYIYVNDADEEGPEKHCFELQFILEQSF